MRPAIALIPSEGDVQKAPVIQRVAFCCIFFSSLMFLTIGAPLKNQRLNLYNAMGKIQVLYRSRFCMGSMPCEELSSVTNFIWSYLHQIFNDSHGLITSLKPLKRPFN